MHVRQTHKVNTTLYNSRDSPLTHTLANANFHACPLIFGPVHVCPLQPYIVLNSYPTSFTIFLEKSSRFHTGNLVLTT